MRTKNRRFLILLGILLGALVVGVALSPGTSAGDRVTQAFANFLEELGLLPSRRSCPSHKNACIANLKQIDGAKAIWALENKKTSTDIPTEIDLYADKVSWAFEHKKTNSEIPSPKELSGTKAYLGFVPVCPQGGRYVIGSVQQKPRCSIPGHTI